MRNKKCILVVDDERLIVMTTCILLRHLGYETREAFDGESALAAARKDPPDIILLDLMMPGLDGWQVLARLKGYPETADIPVVIFSAKEYANAEITNNLRGAAGQISKPFEPEDLEEILQRVELQRDAGHDATEL